MFAENIQSVKWSNTFPWVNHGWANNVDLPFHVNLKATNGDIVATLHCQLRIELVVYLIKKKKKNLLQKNPFQNVRFKRLMSHGDYNYCYADGAK